ncbi:uncharacterized protein RCO7_03821 [Rhynchosporium graminicola]|uniref:Heterokaryon incompatibility domain-containing protein n=1 Tax=Rhynchosporium graminicola TaxID=2792576 RepID=A0A1E1LM16_9HELO|nr:uncharacterized protein RCO7_03821 [Rhynchosporium commune]
MDWIRLCDEGRCLRIGGCCVDPNRARMPPWEDRRTKGSPVTELPQPIQDTIQAARKLDQRYLCIDSTCINQDNHEDWNTGYKKMEAVFQDAYYTIAATSAEESTKGFPNRPLLAEDSNYVT